jgi:GGDEF domain-containing protein
MDETAKDKTFAREKFVQACLTDPIGIIPDLDKDEYDDSLVDAISAIKIALYQQKEKIFQIRRRIRLMIIVGVFFFFIIAIAIGILVTRTNDSNRYSLVIANQYISYRIDKKTGRVWKINRIGEAREIDMPIEDNE